MTELQEMQFEILPNMDAAEGVPFGIGLDVSVDNGGFDPGGLDWFTQDGENPRRGTTAFGRDHFRGPVWLWALHVDRGEDDATAVADALDSLAQLKRAWRAKEIRDTPGAVLPIRYRVGDRVRRVFGRPRRFDAPPDNMLLHGYVPITADFRCVDSYHYDDIEDGVTLSFSNFSEGGFVFPTVFGPSGVASLPPGSQEAAAFVGGDEDTYPVIRFNGPWANPGIHGDGWSLTLNLSLAAGQSVTIDTRPWELSVLRENGASVAGKLGRRQWLEDVRLSPGQHAFVLSGTSSTGGATCAVTWRSAWSSL